MEGLCLALLKPPFDVHPGEAGVSLAKTTRKHNVASGNRLNQLFMFMVALCRAFRVSPPLAAQKVDERPYRFPLLLEERVVGGANQMSVKIFVSLKKCRLVTGFENLGCFANCLTH